MKSIKNQTPQLPPPRLSLFPPRTSGFITTTENGWRLDPVLVHDDDGKPELQPGLIIHITRESHDVYTTVYEQCPVAAQSNGA